jgi:hypothetical protein
VMTPPPDIPNSAEKLLVMSLSCPTDSDGGVYVESPVELLI